jgi:hypothetical protein
MQSVSNARLAILERYSSMDVREVCADLQIVRDLAEKLMGDVASLLTAYKTHTSNHPDDDLRVLTIGQMEAAICSARWCLYGQDTDGLVPTGVRGE